MNINSKNEISIYIWNERNLLEAQMWLMYYEQKFKIIFLSIGNDNICVIDDMESIAYEHAAKYFLKELLLVH
jgi:hypothetical protein